MENTINETEYAKTFRMNYENSVKAPWLLLSLLTRAKKYNKLDEVPMDILKEISIIIDTKGTYIDKMDFNRIMEVNETITRSLEESEFVKKFREEYENSNKAPWLLLLMLTKAQRAGKFNEIPFDILSEISNIIYNEGTELDKIDFARITNINQIITAQEEEKMYNNENEFAKAFRKSYEKSIKKPFVIIVMLKCAQKRDKLDEVPADIFKDMCDIISTKGNDIDKNEFNKLISGENNKDITACGDSYPTMPTSDVCVDAKTYKKTIN